MSQRHPRWVRLAPALAGIGLGLALCGVAEPAAAQDPPGNEENVRAAAQADRDAREARAAGERALPEFSQLVTPENFRGFGFETPDEAKRVVLGAPIAVYSVRLDELRRYQAGASPASLVHGLPQYFLPVQVGDSPRSLIEVARVDNTWKSVRFGSPKVIRTIQAIRASEATKLRRAANTFFVVRILALRLTFVAHREGAQLLLTPTSNAPRYQLDAGRTQAAEVVFQQLVPFAQKLDTSAPS